MKKLLFNLRTLMLLLLMMVGVSSAWGQNPTKCTSTSDLEVGCVYYISGEDNYSSNGTVMGLSTGGNNFPSSKFNDTPCELTLRGNATDGWTFSYVDGATTYFLDPTNTTGSNYLKRNTNVTNYGKFSISFTNGEAVITSKGKSSRNIIRYNSSNSIYSCYSSGQNAVYLYKKAGQTTPPATAYTVTFDAGSNGTCSTSSLTEESAGAGVTLPSCTANTGYRFEGWSTSNTPASADAGVAGATYKPSSGCTLYAYYVPVYTAQFSINGSINAGNNCTVANGEAITFPSDPVDINGKKFVGWTKTQNYSNATTAPSDLCKSANMGNEGVTYYAVFATVDGNGGSACYKNVTDLTPGKTYVFGAVKVAASPTLANDRAIAAVNFTSTSSWGSYTTITPNSSGEIATSNVTSDNLKWVLESITGGAYTFKSGNNYLSLSTSTGASTAGVSTTSACVYLEDASSTCAAAFLIHPSSNSSNKLLCNTGTNYGYRMYGSSTNATASMCPYVRFYEYDSGVSYSDYCTSVVTLPTPTVTFEGKALPSIFYAAGGSGETAVAGDTYTRTATASNEGNITYTSSNTNIAIVDPATGEVIAVAPGNVTIAATTPAVDGISNQASASYDITVSARPVVEAISFSPAAGVVEKGATITISCVTEGAAILYSVDGSDPIIEYTEPIAINSSCTIKAKATKDTYVPAVGSATYTVVKSAQTVTFETSAYSFRLNSDEYNSFNNSVPQTATSTYGSANITYSSNNPSVVDVNSTSGAITLKGETGKATITATAAETEDYNSASASYTITVLRAGVTRTGDFRMVTNVSDLKDGDYVLLTSKKNGDKVSAFKGSATSFQSLTVTNDEISKDNLSEAVVLTVGKKSIDDKDYFTFVYGDDSEDYLAADNSTTAAGNVISEKSVSDYSRWNLTIAPWGTVVAKVKAKSEYCVLSFNGNNLKTYKNALQKDSLYIYKQLDYNLQAQTLEFATSSYMFPLNEAEYNNWSHQEVTGAETTVTYTSSNTDVADVNNEGKIVLKGGVGASTITASAAEENGYNRASATYTITVTQALRTVSFVVNGTPNAIKETESNGGIAIPVNPTAVGEYAFLGWGSAELAETLDRPDFKESFKPGDLYKPTNNETYYAIFGREANGNGTFYLKDENNYASAPTATTFSNTTTKDNAAVFGYTNEGKVYYMDGESRRYFSSVSSETGSNGRVLTFNDVEASAIAWNIIEANGKIQFQSTGGNNKYFVHNNTIWAAYASGTGTNTFIKEYLAPYYFTTAPTTLSTPTIAFANPTDVTIAIDEVSNNVATSSSSAPVTYTSSNPEVASVDNEGNVKGLAVGTTIITAQVAAVPEISLQASVSYKVTVERITTEIAFKDAESNTITTADVYADNEYTFTAQTNSDATIVYSLSATTYATINGATGVITFKPATGATWTSDKQVTAYAKVDQTDRYTAASSNSLAAKLTITIKDNRKDQIVQFAQSNYEFTVGSSEGTVFTNSFADGKAPKGDVTYSSNNENIATVNETTGKVTVNTASAGTATITANIGSANVTEDGTVWAYKATTASYIITITKADARLAFTSSEINTTIDDSMIDLSEYITKSTDAEVVYSLQEGTAGAELADEIFEATMAGDYVVTASVAETSSYLAGDASITIHVTDSRAIPTFAFSEPSYTYNVMKIFDLSENLTNNSDGNVTWSLDDDTYADIDNNGVFYAEEGGHTVTVTATVARSENYQQASASCTINIVDNRTSPMLTLTDGTANAEKVQNRDITLYKNAMSCTLHANSAATPASKGAITYKDARDGSSFYLNQETGEFVGYTPGTYYVKVTIAATEVYVSETYQYNITILDEYPVFSATIADCGYTTVCLPYNATVEEGATAYALSEISTEGNLLFNSVQVMKANAGYIIKGEAGGNYNVTYSSAGSDDDSNILDGVTERTARNSMTFMAEGSSYQYPWILAKDGTFKKYTGEYIPANKAYLDGGYVEEYVNNTGASSATLRVVFTEKEETGLENMSEIYHYDSIVYDLIGKKVQSINKSGLYIVNGKKVVIK